MVRYLIGPLKLIKDLRLQARKEMADPVLLKIGNSVTGAVGGKFPYPQPRLIGGPCPLPSPRLDLLLNPSLCFLI